MSVANFIFITFTALFSVVNPLGAIPYFLSITHSMPEAVRNRISRKAAINVACILIAFLLLGTYIMGFFGITVEGMKIAGGLIIMRSGYNLLNADYQRGKGLTELVQEEARHKDDISFSPLAMPMLSGRVPFRCC